MYVYVAFEGWTTCTNVRLERGWHWRAGGVKNNLDLLTDVPTPVRVSECSSVQDQQLT